MSKPIIAYKNIFASGVTATDTAATYSVDNIYDWRPYTSWKADSFGTKYITMDAGAAVDVDTLCFQTHNLGTASATVSLESSTTGAWGGEEVEQIAGFQPANDNAIAKVFTQATVRYWRVKIITGAIAAQIGCVVLGAQMIFPTYPGKPFTADSQGVNVTANNPRGGHIFRVKSYYTPLDISVSFTWPTMYFVDNIYAEFWHTHGKKLIPFFWIENITDYPNKIYFVRLTDGASNGTAQNDPVYGESHTMSMIGIAE
jgi:hypothetical protein